ncbi:MAG: four-carbon acid sugar kinase family protein, partial [Acidobacteriota bacterium]
MPRLLVIADDLTGANDVGVQFARHGISTQVVTEMTVRSSPARLPVDHQVVVVNIESRHLSAAQAGQRVRRVVADGIGSGMTHFYKKTDSSLRGNIGSELEALMSASSCRALPFIPAFPKLKRTTRTGLQFISGTLLHESAFANDPLEPMTDSFIPSIIQRQTATATRVLSTSEVLMASPKTFLDKAIYVLDAVTDTDLQAAGIVLKLSDLLRVTAGSAGFAECLATLVGFQRKPIEPVHEDGRMLLVNGSMNNVSLEQVKDALGHGFVPVTLPPETLLADESPRS